MNRIAVTGRAAEIGWRWAAALCAVALVALLLRALGFEWVFVGGDSVVFPPADPQYHVRRAFHAWMEFPRVLMRDPYLNHPDGAAVPWPPLFDFAVAAAAKLLARDAVGFQRVAAWMPPLFGALAVIPVYLLGRELRSRGVGLGAAALVATFPISVSYSQVGELDHHCAVQPIGAFLLLLCARLAAGTGSPISLGWGLAIGRVTMLLTWPGSLLYLALLDATLFVAAIVGGRRSVSGAQSASALAALACVAPFVWLVPEPIGGAYSAIALSRLHLLALAATGLAAGCLWGIGRPPGRWVASAWRRAAWTVGAATALGAPLLLVPQLRDGLELGLRFLTMRDAVGSETLEQLPLFSLAGRAAALPAWQTWGGFAYAIPLAPLAAVLAARRERRAAGWVVGGWAAFFGILAVTQHRYGNDLAPSAALAFALALAAASRFAASFMRPRVRAWAAPLLACGLGLALLAPALWVEHRPRARSALRALSGGYDGIDRAAVTAAGSLTRFMQTVRAVTPETAGYLDSSRTPEYGIAADPNLGHALKSVAHRASSSDPFAAPIGQVNWMVSMALLRAPSEARAIARAAQLEARYVVTMPSASPSRLQGWLHHRDGLAQPGWPRTERFRLITEGPPGGTPYTADIQALGFRVREPGSEGEAGAVPYKLFEIVEGAVLEVRDEPGVDVIAGLDLRTPIGRTIRFEARGRTDDQGIARLRVPYPTERSLDPALTAARGPYLVSTPAGNSAVHVSEQQVRAGAPIPVPSPDAPAAKPKRRERPAAR